MAYVEDIYGKVKVPAPPKPPTTTYVQPSKTPAPSKPAAPAPPKQNTSTSSKASYDPAVAAKQMELKAAGYDPGPIDGIRGPKTIAAENASKADYDAWVKSQQNLQLGENFFPGSMGRNGEIEAAYEREQNPGWEGEGYNQPDSKGTVGNTTDPTLLALQKQIASLTDIINQQSQVPALDINALKSAIQNRFGSIKSGLLAKIEAAKNKAKDAYSGLSDQAVQKSQSDLEANNADLAQSLKRVFEGSEAAGGYRGGMSVQGQIDANTTAQNNANAIRLNKTNTLNNIANAIEQINRNAEQEKIAAEADTDAQLAQALADAEQFGASYDLQRAGVDLQNRQFDFSKGIQEGQLTGTYNGTDTLAKKQFDAEQAWNEWNKQWQIENEAWQRNPENPQVQAQVLANKAQLLANQLAELELQNYPEEQKLKIQEYKKRIAQIGAAPALSQYDIDLKKAQLDQIKAETDKLRNPEPAQPSQTEISNYYTSSAMNELSKLPDYESKKKWLDQHAAEIIQNAGTSAYSFLLDQLY